ncbi:MAG TPA: selenium cofactor biosynthesis protein YqeC [Syntrophorhabdaceae bacterium]|jgi:probable selenium-dependent hydroxylase accessory protein YqeC
MWHFQKIDPLLLLAGRKYISVVGGGGKSTIIEFLAGRQAMAGKSVALTTTTRIYAKEPFILFSDFESFSRGPATRVGKTHEDGKLTGLAFEEVRSLGESADTVLIEADGAKHFPLKFPAPHEPVVPPFSDRIFVVGGLDALHCTVEKAVFRWKLLPDPGEIAGDTVISEEIFLSFFSERAMLKDVERRKCTIILNKYDLLRDRGEAFHLAKALLDRKKCAEVVVSSAALGFFYKLAHA